jgi:hypothetical protein
VAAIPKMIPAAVKKRLPMAAGLAALATLMFM